MARVPQMPSRHYQLGTSGFLYSHQHRLVKALGAMPMVSGYSPPVPGDGKAKGLCMAHTGIA